MDTSVFRNSRFVMINTYLLIAILICCLYLVWRAKDSHWHSQVEWQVLNEIADRQVRNAD